MDQNGGKQVGGKVEAGSSSGHVGVLPSSHLFVGKRDRIVILHNDERYRLQITRNGKLILTK